MGVDERGRLRTAALHLDRYRLAIEAEVGRRLGRSEPSPHARAEIVRRFRSFCRLASIDPRAARPSLDGLGGNSAAALERALHTAVGVAIECSDDPDLPDLLRDLESRFAAGIRKVMRPPPEEKRVTKGRRGRAPNAGRRVRAAIDRIPDAYLAVCLDTSKIFDLNPAAEALLGLEPEKVLERPLGEFISPAYREAFEDLEARLDAGEETETNVKIVFCGRGGDIPVELSVANHTIGSRRLAIFVARETIPRG